MHPEHRAFHQFNLFVPRGPLFFHELPFLAQPFFHQVEAFGHGFQPLFELRACYVVVDQVFLVLLPNLQPLGFRDFEQPLPQHLRQWHRMARRADIDPVDLPESCHPFRQSLTDQHRDFRPCPALIFAQFGKPCRRPVFGPFAFPQDAACGLAHAI